MPSKPVTLRLPEELLAAIDAQVEMSESNRTDVVVEALEQVFSKRGSESEKTVDEAHLCKRIDRLERRVSQLEAQIGDRTSLLEREVQSTGSIAGETAKSNNNCADRSRPAIAARESSSDLPTETEASATLGKAPKRTGESVKEIRQPKRKGTVKSTKSSQKRAIAEKSSKGGGSEWLAVKEAFEQLGGDPSDVNAVVTSLDGSRSVKFNRFRVLSASDYQAFGLEFRPDRRRRRLPCLRLL
ncbi:hypothetical protein JJD41_24150 [Oxynema sp. CENA135]|uniref:hypothetical protein n=1 Tax=Oxynema sp. CENA135 TaxID=984206 RepID=UPI00190CCE9B|nr:hypothetical protein [Oxynema sp. CENA135]MBK4732939.1 hypothetical protein [Oxynema sp. CENA135]